MSTSTSWHGTPGEHLELTRALSHHCTCAFDTQSQRLSMCAGHEMLHSDQRAIDGLIFSRRIAALLRSEEFHSRPDRAVVPIRLMIGERGMNWRNSDPAGH